MLDLTPNYPGSSSWFAPVEKDVQKVAVRRGSRSAVLPSQRWRWKRSPGLRFALCPQAAAEYWFGLGVDGIKVSDLAVASGSADWSKLQDVVQKNSSQDGKRR